MDCTKEKKDGNSKLIEQSRSSGTPDTGSTPALTPAQIWPLPLTKMVYLLAIF